MEALADSLSGRLAVVPMSQEARGLDAGPRLVERLRGWGDMRSADIVARIGQEEKAHVAVGKPPPPPPPAGGGSLSTERAWSTQAAAYAPLHATPVDFRCTVCSRQVCLMVGHEERLWHR